jgi:transcriptional regulator with XRE-family HTH domain
MPEPSTHIGRKISRIRELRGMKQEHLASELGISQQGVSKIEQSEKIEDEVLDKVAKVLGVPSEAIKNYDDETAVNIIANSFTGEAVAFAQYYKCQIDPVQRWLDTLDELKALHEENKKLYERLLASEREKNELLKEKRN